MLSEKHEWIVNFDEIKFTDDLKEILYNYSISGFNDQLTTYSIPLSTLILIKKCHTEIDKNVNLKITTKSISNRNINDLQTIKSAINSNFFEIISNVDNNLKSQISKLIFHLINVCENLDQLCFFVEKRLSEVTNTQWHCFCQKIYPFMERLFNWFDYPLYIIYFANQFLETIVEIAIINTYISVPKEVPEFASIINTMTDEMSEKSVNISYKAIEECDSIEKMQLYISNGLKQIYNNVEWNCYISKNELISFCNLFPNPKYKYAFRIKYFCILIVSESIKNIICDKVDEKTLSKMSIDDQNVINQVFTPQIINCILILRKIELTDEKICIVRISESCQFSSHNYTNHQIFIYDVQILWINNNRSNKKKIYFL